MPGSKTHQNFGLVAYAPYAVLVAGVRPDFIGWLLVSTIPAMLGAHFPDILDPPNGWKHRANAHSPRRLGTYFLASVLSFIASFFTAIAIPIAAFTIGYVSHLIADATTPSGLPAYRESPKEYYPDNTILQKKKNIRGIKNILQCRSYSNPPDWDTFEEQLPELQNRTEGLFVFFTKDKGKSLSPLFPGTRIRRGKVSCIVSDISDTKTIKKFVWNVNPDIVPLKIEKEEELLFLLHKNNIPYVIHRIWKT